MLTGSLLALTGNSKLVIQSAVVRDATGALPAAPGTEEGKVLTLWNPDESWSRDALLRVNAVLGPATRTHTIYEHIEVVVHPLGVHLNEAVAQSFWVSAQHSAFVLLKPVSALLSCWTFRGCIS